MPYHVVYSKPRQEDRAVENLKRQGYAPFLPICRKPRKLDIKPLFPRYIFVFVCTENPWKAMNSTYGVTSVLRRSDHVPMSIEDAVVDRIRDRMTADGGAVILEDDEPEKKNLIPGQEIRIVAGSHVGFGGLFVGREKDRIIALLNLFGRQVRTTVHESQVA